MTMQLNLRVSEDFFNHAQQYAKIHGFLNIQEFFREAAREKIYEQDQVRSEYLEKLNSIEASTFMSEIESEKFERELKKRAKLK